MPPVLDPVRSKVDGLAFLGLSLSRKSTRGHAGSSTHQQSFDLELLQDRDYEHVFSTSDDGWLAGGGEPGPPHSYKLAARDSAHIEIMRISTYREDWGGLPREFVVDTLRKGLILIPEITVVPTGVVANGDRPPELEIRFDMVPNIPNFNDLSAPLPLNWQLRFIQNQLFHKFRFASRFTPGAFHSTILRKAEFRSEADKKVYLNKCRAVCDKWMNRGVQPLAPSRDGVSSSVEVVKCVRREPKRIDSDEESRTENEEEEDQYYRSGIWLFTDRNNISHQFLPNFLPPYDTPIKKKLILAVLKEEWDEKRLTWKTYTTKFDSIIPRPLPVSPIPENYALTRNSPEKRPVNTNQASNLGMFDPADEIGFMQFMSSFGTNMADMTSEVCGPMLGGQTLSSDSFWATNSVMEDEKDDSFRTGVDRQPVAIVKGQRLSQKDLGGSVIDVTRY